ncbi:MAG: N-formylglutamate amidohydrolase [Dehalococcoidia bacterium]
MAQRKTVMNIAFESKQLSYSEREVDLYNSGVNQLLSVAAARGHNLFHFSMTDLFMHEDVPYARASILALPEWWEGDPLESYMWLQKIDERPLAIKEVQLCFARADDVRDSATPNIEILRAVERNGVLIESVAANLSTGDKFEIKRRLPHIPQPVTYEASTKKEALSAIRELPEKEGVFVLKDRFGYGCGEQVHLIEFKDPQIEEIIEMYLATYDHIILQEFCPEIRNGDIVVTFLDGDLIAPMHREPGWGEWRTNICQGGTQRFYTLTAEQEQIARSVISAFPECRFASVDMLQSGKVLEINAFPGGKGLYEIYGISVGNILMNKLEEEILGKITVDENLTRQTVVHTIRDWDYIYDYYEEFESPVEVRDVFSEETLNLYPKEIIEFRHRSSDFVLSVPHSGMLLPTRYLDLFRLNHSCMLEIDLYSDIIYGTLGGLQLISRFAPFFVDMNRDRKGIEDEDIPRHLRNPATEYYSIDNEMFLEKPYTAKQKREVLKYYDLYHRILDDLSMQMKSERGYALIIDGHSMSSVGLGRVHDEGQPRNDFVVGTLEDTSASPEIITAFVEALRSGAEAHGLGLTIAENDPYAGGFITRRHHDPGNRVHAIQIEVTMNTYMYEPTDENLLKRYALKQPRVMIVQEVLAHASRAACEAAERVYS